MARCKNCGHDLPAGFCHACCRDFEPEAMSSDPRYCQGCYEFLLAEGKLLPAGRGKPYWVPASEPRQALPVKEEVVTKIPTKGKLPVAIMSQRRGRPRKGGEVSQRTEYRRRRIIKLMQEGEDEA